MTLVMPNLKQEIQKKFFEFHLKFTHSPLLITLDNEQEVTIVNLPVDFKWLLAKIKEDKGLFQVRTLDHDTVKVIVIDFKNGCTILKALTMRYENSKAHLMSCLKKLETLEHDAQIRKLNNDFHNYYRLLITNVGLQQIIDMPMSIGDVDV